VRTADSDRRTRKAPFTTVYIRELAAHLEAELREERKRDPQDVEGRHAEEKGLGDRGGREGLPRWRKECP